MRNVGSGEGCPERRKAWFVLEEGIPALEEPDIHFWIDDRFDYDEERIVTLGTGESNFGGVSTVREFDTTRIYFGEKGS